MNILMMTNTFAPFVGGVERSVMTFADELRTRGHRVLIVTPECDNMPRHERDVLRVPAVQRFNGTDFPVRLPIPGVLHDALDRFAPDIVHSHHPFLLGDTALRTGASRGIPVVFTHHTFYEHYTHYVPGDSPELKRFAAALATGYANLCDAVIAPSDTVRKEIISRGVETPVTTIPTGIDTARLSTGSGRRFRALWGLGATDQLIGTVSRLAPEKNLVLLAEGVLQYMRAHPDARCVVVGSGPEEDTLRRTFREAGRLDHLLMTGSLEGRDLMDAYAALDLFVFASQSETQGLVLAEAMAAGVPVVALPGPAVVDVVEDGRNGMLADGKSAASLAAAIHRWEDIDEDRRAALAEGATVTAKAFETSRCAEALLDLYTATLEGERRQQDIDESPWERTRRVLQTQGHLFGVVAAAATDAVTGHAPDA